MVFEGITGVCERICQFNFKSIRKKGKYEFEIIGGTFLLGGGGGFGTAPKLLFNNI